MSLFKQFKILLNNNDFMDFEIYIQTIFNILKLIKLRNLK